MTATAILNFGQTTFWSRDLFPSSILYICCIIVAIYVHPTRSYSYFLKIQDKGRHLEVLLDEIFLVT